VRQFRGLAFVLDLIPVCMVLLLWVARERLWAKLVQEPKAVLGILLMALAGFYCFRIANQVRASCRRTLHHLHELGKRDTA
jgi:hypothetical protein